MNLNKPAKIIIDDEETEDDVQCIVCRGDETCMLIESEISIGVCVIHAGERLCLGCLSFLFYRGREPSTTPRADLSCVCCGKKCTHKYDTEKVLTSHMTRLEPGYRYTVGDAMCEACYGRSRRCKHQIKACVCCGFEKVCRYVTEKTVTEKTRLSKPAYIYFTGDAMCESCYAKASHRIESVCTRCACCDDTKICEYKSKKTLSANITLVKPGYRYALGDRMCKTCYRAARLIIKQQ